MVEEVKTAITVNNLKKHYGKIKAVDGISFEVQQGEIFGFLGPNGAGKTTTIRCIMDFVHPTSGSISVLGLDSRVDAARLKEQVGYLAPEPRLYGNWSGWEHIRFIESIVGKCGGLEGLLDKLKFDPSRKAKKLSSGNKQKLGLILALMSNPKLLILDEPTTGLDPLLQNAIYSILQDHTKNGGTVFISSHNLAEVERLCNRVGIIKNGGIVAIEKIQDLKKKQMYTAVVYFAQEFNVHDFVRADIEIVKRLEDGLQLTYRGDINNLLDLLSRYKIRDIELKRASLEDIFVEFYK